MNDKIGGGNIYESPLNAPPEQPPPPREKTLDAALDIHWIFTTII